ncbi:MAG: hotdog domain-containing protein [Kiritimatiellae bacterium]|nr:hotdog domain-containing protein [Kiritimatiellia bacterium]MDD3544285.1 hotdog domain-containing protein [Kiritimatiellia bacterium]MDD4024916.1 hotdog domain-containing protein [Kiritimatiellia bacterium]MDD4623059.1 hotdog domain-containing protein [Kiritimatiellia bacterium]
MPALSGHGLLQGRNGMVSYKLVMPEHTNQYGVLFGGNLLKWVDETAWMAVSLDYPCARFVTIGMNRVEFKKGVSCGTILRFEILKKRIGKTSVTYAASVTHSDCARNAVDVIFITDITFVRVDDAGKKMPLACCDQD